MNLKMKAQNTPGNPRQEKAKEFITNEYYKKCERGFFKKKEEKNKHE